MPREVRRQITEPEALAALAHPVRLELINYLMASGPATASVCARAVGDTPSNCSYHLRTLAKAGLVGTVESEDGRERPWRALVTGYDTDMADPDQPLSPEASRLLAVTLQRDQQVVRDFMTRRHVAPTAWRSAYVYSTYTLRVSPDELMALGTQIDAMIRPYLAATREGAPDDADLVHVGLNAVPTPDRASRS
jgi:DNA-binding transcriptional ArsR family regulator